MSGVANQRAYQWFADGTETGSAALAAVNTAVAVAPNSLVLLRLAIDLTGGSFTLSSPRLQVSDQANVNYADLGNFGVSGWNGGTTPGGLSHNVACTNRLAGTGNWQAGGNTTTLASGGVNSCTISNSVYINYLFALQIGNIPGATRYFRLAHTGAALSIVVNPQITVTSPSPKLYSTLSSGGLLSPLASSLGGSI